MEGPFGAALHRSALGGRSTDTGHERFPLPLLQKRVRVLCSDENQWKAGVVVGFNHG